MFIYSLANELKITVVDLCSKLTVEEMVGWAAFYKIRNEEQEKAQDRTQRRSVIPKSR
mgnify:CR=1 FL=1|tara:strand:+ start:1662 stop:1835 length:174 start_codon:yes stop_codon:yes gene_type:complete